MAFSTFSTFNIPSLKYNLAIPNAPTGVSATTSSSSSASVSFTASTGATSYTVTSSPGGLTGTGSSSPITVSGLTGGTAYTFTVTATNTSGTSSASSASTSITTVPSAPTGVSATVLSSSSATVSFTASTGATSYKVTSSPGGLTGTGSSSPITVSGLTGGTAYTFTVTATNATGTSSSSSASSSVTTTSVFALKTTGFMFPDNVGYFTASNSFNETVTGGKISSLTYSSGTGTNAYLNGTYYLSASSYQPNGTYNGVSLGLPYILFSSIKNKDYFYHSGSSSGNVNLDISQNTLALYTQYAYNTSSKNYQGGGGAVGSANYFRTTYNTSSTVAGEYIQTKFPFKILITKLEMLVRDTNTAGNRVPNNVTILGSDDGSTWSLVSTVSFTINANPTLSNATISTSSYYYYYRFVVTSLSTAIQGIINLCQFRITGNTYSNV
jgi:hypothetical protein